MEKMTVEEFKEYCVKNDYNIVDEWDFKRFSCKCLECNSNNLQIGHKTKEMAEGSTMTGMWTFQNEGLLVKCLDCGQAMTIDW